MPEESTTPDLVELVRGFWASASRSDWDAILRFYAPDAVWDMSPLGLGTYEDEAAMRGLWDDWVGAYQELELEVEAVDLGNEVVSCRARPGRPSGWQHWSGSCAASTRL